MIYYADSPQTLYVTLTANTLYHRLAALGAMAYLTQEERVCKCVVRIGSWIEVIKEVRLPV